MNLFLVQPMYGASENLRANSPQLFEWFLSFSHFLFIFFLPIYMALLIILVKTSLAIYSKPISVPALMKMLDTIIMVPDSEKIFTVRGRKQFVKMEHLPFTFLCFVYKELKEVFKKKKFFTPF